MGDWLSARFGSVIFICAAAFVCCVARAEGVETGPGIRPVVLRATLPQKLDGGWEPLLAVGVPGAGDVVFCRRLADGRVVFGWEQVGAAAALSEPVEIRNAGTQEILISLGSMLPPEEDPLYAKAPALALLRTIALVQLGGRTVLMAKGEFPLALGTVSTGKNPVGGAMAGPFYSGVIEAQSPADWSVALAAAVAPGQLIAHDPSASAEAREFPGPLRLKLRFPGGGGGHNEPLVVTGVTGRGDFVYVRYEDDRHLRLGFDHWLVGGPLSALIECDVTEPHEVVVSMGSLFPPPDPARPDSPEVAALRGQCVVLLDGKPAISHASAFHPTKAEQVTLFSNMIGGSTANPVFTGTIFRVERVRPEEVLRAVSKK